jgi:hypothetical protein
MADGDENAVALQRPRSSIFIVSCLGARNGVTAADNDDCFPVEKRSAPSQVTHPDTPRPRPIPFVCIA